MKAERRKRYRQVAAIIVIGMMAVVIGIYTLKDRLSCEGMARQVAIKLQKHSGDKPEYIQDANARYLSRKVPDELADTVLACREDAGFLIYYLDCDLYGGRHVVCTTTDPTVQIKNIVEFIGERKVYQYVDLGDNYCYIIIK